MEQRYILGATVLVVAAAFILSSAARKVIRSIFYLLGVLSLLLAGVCAYALIFGRNGNQDSAGFLFFIIGAVFFAGASYGAFKYASGMKAFETSHYDVHDRVSTPIPIPGWIKDISYSLAGIQTYLLFFASREFYHQNVVAKRDGIVVVLIPAIYFGLTRLARVARPLEGSSRAKESLFFVLTAVLSLMLFVMSGIKILRSQISFVKDGIEVVEQTKRGGFINSTSLEKDLKKAIIAGDVASVEKLLDEGASVVGREKSLDMSPLLLALSKRQSRVAETLIRRGAPVGETELKYSIVNVDAAAIRMALSKNKTVPKDCRDCFQAAARLGDSELTAYLLDQIAQNDERGIEIYQRALAVLLTMPNWEPAKKEEYNDTYDFLLAKSAKPEGLIDGYLPLFSFANQMHIYEDRFLFLKQKGANLNAQDKDGNTYLHFAARGSEASYEKLLDIGLDPNIRNNAGETPADIRARRHPSK